jgi:hypothetical protein
MEGQTLCEAKQTADMLLKLPKGLSAAVNFKNLFKKNKSARFSKS